MFERISLFRAERAIRACSSKESLETAFNKHKISDIGQRIKLLLKAMGNPAFSYSCGFPEPKERYKIIADTYISGIWRKDYYSLENKRKAK
jgi:hypothetical protein